MRRESKAERDAWTAHVEGEQAAKPSKYGNQREGKYASKREAEVAGQLAALASRGLINDLKEQERIVLVPGNGKLRSIVYVADFTWIENGKRIVADAKGFMTPVYRLKKRLLKLLHDVEIREL